jgi:hypothetical protein
LEPGLADRLAFAVSGACGRKTQRLAVALSSGAGGSALLGTRQTLREAFSNPAEGKPKKTGKTIKADGSKIQILSFSRSRLFNGLCHEARKSRSFPPDRRAYVSWCSRRANQGSNDTTQNSIDSAFRKDISYISDSSNDRR